MKRNEIYQERLKNKINKIKDFIKEANDETLEEIARAVSNYDDAYGMDIFDKFRDEDWFWPEIFKG